MRVNILLFNRPVKHPDDIIRPRKLSVKGLIITLKIENVRSDSHGTFELDLSLLVQVRYYSETPMLYIHIILVIKKIHK